MSFGEGTCLNLIRRTKTNILGCSAVQLAATLARRPNAVLDLSQGGLNILELGSGTGALASLLTAAQLLGSDHSGCRIATWLATDQDEIVPLLSKNAQLAQNSSPSTVNILAQPLDWVEAASAFTQSASQALRYRRQLFS